MTTMTEQATQVYQVFIKATPEQIWEAITTPEFTMQYFHGSRVEGEWESGGAYRGYSPDRSQVWVEGEVLESDPPRRLQHTWRSLYNEDQAKEPASRVTWEIEERDGGVSILRVTHDELERSPLTAVGVSGEGWMHVISGLKTLLETGKPLFTE
jgi:uncharacterized protein YndB with AHSA1/START domain